MNIYSMNIWSSKTKGILRQLLQAFMQSLLSFQQDTEPYKEYVITPEALSLCLYFSRRCM